METVRDVVVDPEFKAGNGFGYRSLTPYEKAELALRLEPYIRARAKENQGSARAARRHGPTHTRLEISRLAGISHDTLARIMAIQGKIDPETKERLRQRKTSVNAEYQKIKSVQTEQGLF